MTRKLNPKSKSAHTPTPWKVKDGYLACMAKNKYIVLNSPWTEGAWENDYEAKANHAFIVRACNSHERLLGALEAIRARIHGEFDNPALVRWGALRIDSIDDILAIATSAIAEAEK